MNMNLKLVPGYYDYLISDSGEVISFKRGVPKKMKQKISNSGYCNVGLFDAFGNQKSYFVHRIVYETFVGPIPEGLQIDHIDGQKINNHVSNLRLCSPKENTHFHHSKNSEDVGISFNKRHKNFYFRIHEGKNRFVLVSKSKKDCEYWKQLFYNDREEFMKIVNSKKRK